MKALIALVTGDDMFSYHLKMTRHVQSLSDGSGGQEFFKDSSSPLICPGEC